MLWIVAIPIVCGIAILIVALWAEGILPRRREPKPVLLRLCGECRHPHPESANYCRRCGRSLWACATEAAEPDPTLRRFYVSGAPTFGAAMRAPGVPRIGRPLREGSPLTVHTVDVSMVSGDVAHLACIAAPQGVS
jgi:hypothetical protein